MYKYREREWKREIHNSLGIWAEVKFKGAKLGAKPSKATI